MCIDCKVAGRLQMEEYGTIIQYLGERHQDVVSPELIEKKHAQCRDPHNCTCQHYVRPFPVQGESVP